MNQFYKHVFRIAVALALLVGLVAPLRAAPGASAQLRAFFTEVKSLRAEFIQQVRNAKTGRLDETQGTLVMQRPNTFRWDYTKPYRQQIVADGVRLWVFDADLEQVIVKPLDEAIGSTPALLLSGGGGLDERFAVEDLTDTSEGLAWVRLTPKNKDAGFEALTLGFAGRDLRMMDLLDSFGQRTHIEFSKLQRNVVIDQTLFRFTPPPGVDVIGEGVEAVKR